MLATSTRIFTAYDTDRKKTIDGQRTASKCQKFANYGPVQPRHWGSPPWETFANAASPCVFPSVPQTSAQTWPVRLFGGANKPTNRCLWSCRHHTQLRHGGTPNCHGRGVSKQARTQPPPPKVDRYASPSKEQTPRTHTRTKGVAAKKNTPQHGHGQVSSLLPQQQNQWHRKQPPPSAPAPSPPHRRKFTIDWVPPSPLSTWRRQWISSPRP